MTEAAGTAPRPSMRRQAMPLGTPAPRKIDAIAGPAMRPRPCMANTEPTRRPRDRLLAYSEVIPAQSVRAPSSHGGTELGQVGDATAHVGRDGAPVASRRPIQERKLSTTAAGDSRCTYSAGDATTGGRPQHSGQSRARFTQRRCHLTCGSHLVAPWRARRPLTTRHRAARLKGSHCVRLGAPTSPPHFRVRRTGQSRCRDRRG